MQHRAIAIALIAFAACAGAFGEEQLSTDAGHLQKASSPSPDRASSSKINRRTPKSPRSASQPVPLSSAEAYASEHSAQPSISAPKEASPTTNSWTGFYLGAGVGGARQ